MVTKHKVLTVSQLQKELGRLKKYYGDLPIYISSDPEGNSFGGIIGNPVSCDSTGNSILLFVDLQVDMPE